MFAQTVDIFIYIFFTLSISLSPFLSMYRYKLYFELNMLERYIYIILCQVLAIEQHEYGHMDHFNNATVRQDKKELNVYAANKVLLIFLHFPFFLLLF